MLKKVKCNLCSADHYDILYKIPKTSSASRDLKPGAITTERIVKCLRCGLVYLNPRRSNREILGDYRRMISQDYAKEEVGLRINARVILRKLKRYKKGKGRILMVGCAGGFLLDEAKKAGWQVFGTDISKWAVEFAKERLGLDIFYGSLKRAKFPAGHFDVIVLSDIFEHLTNPKDVLLEIRPLLSPQGVVYINTPNIDSFISNMLKSRWWGLRHSHLYYFTKRTLEEMLDAAGFKAVKWTGYKRAYSLSYWLKRIELYDKGLYELMNRIVKWGFIRSRLIRVNFGDQIEVIARRKRQITYLPEVELAKPAASRKKMKVAVVLPAYNAAKTLRQTVEDIPKDIVDEIILVDDCSKDDTVKVAKELGLIVYEHKKNTGYGGNQKTCYTKALERGAGIVVMVHPDYQYDPKVIPQMISPIQNGECDAVFCSRMLKGGTLEGGMPLWKHNANIILTAIENVILGTYLTEYHSGFRAYGANLLQSIKFTDNSDSFIFDTEIIVQTLLHYFKIEEIPIRTRYFDEASVIKLGASIHYGLGIFITLLKYIFHKRGIIKFRQFE